MSEFGSADQASGDDGARGAPSRTPPRASTRDEVRLTGVLGHALHAHYQDLVSEPLPGRFLELLAQLEAKEKQGG